MDRIKAKGLIGLSRKAGYCIIGSENLENYTKKLYLVLIDKTAGKTSQKIANSFCEKAKILQVEGLGELVSIPTCKIIAIKNKNLSESIWQNLVEN